MYAQAYFLFRIMAGLKHLLLFLPDGMIMK